MLPKFEFGDSVRLVRNVRNDGTYPGEPTGRLLIRRGSIGYVRDVGTFLQDQLIYTVDFIEAGRRVGCREQELQSLDDPWIPTRFDFRDKVTPLRPLAVGGAIIARPGDEGEVEKTLPEHDGGPACHVRFHGRVLLVTEASLAFINPEKEAGL
ncbi:MAG: nitrogen fixation protein NifZ [Gammaproteobacteria bacterium]|nr:nitrogen fixation protein NifZ [Gammaproteobacteria bacterium]